jgi:hypothetical protein
MAEIDQHSEPAPEHAGPTPPDPPRRPYEAPRLVKKRSVARATLFTAMGPTMSGLTTMG